MLTRLTPSLLKLPVRSLSSQLNVYIDRANEAYFVRLNKQRLSTPMKNKLQLPDETLALAIANEWKANLGKRKKLDLANMHLTTLAYTAIDNPFGESDEQIISSILEYLKFDTVRFRDADNQELLSKQSRHWDPLIGWFEHKFQCHLPIEYGDLTSINSLPQATHDTILRYLQSHDRWSLIGINFMAQNLKSFVLTASLADRFLKVEKAVELSRLETRHQTEKWSKVEWEHDLDEQCTNTRVSAGCLFYHLSLPNGATGGEQVSSLPKKERKALKPSQRHEDPKNRIMTIPNALTFARLSTAPAIGYFIWNGMYVPALGCFAFAALTDLLDGLLARLLNQQTDLGALMDPIADKLLLTTSFVAMVHTGLMPIWCVKAFVLRDVLLLLSGAVIRYNGFEEKPTLKKFFDFKNHPTYGFEPTFLSKVNTALQCSLILTHLTTYHMVGNAIYDWGIFGLQLTTAITTALTLGQYANRCGETYLFFSYPKKTNH